MVSPATGQQAMFVHTASSLAGSTSSRMLVTLRAFLDITDEIRRHAEAGVSRLLTPGLRGPESACKLQIQAVLSHRQPLPVGPDTDVGRFLVVDTGVGPDVEPYASAASEPLYMARRPA